MKKSEDNVSLRVLHIASWYPSKEHGSLGNFIQRHVGAVAKKHESEVWYAAPVSNDSPLLGSSEVIERDGFLERIAYPKATKPGARAVTRALLKMVPGRNISMPDLVHLHVAFPAGRAARMLSESWDVPLVITEHWTAYHDSQHIPLWRKISMRRTAAYAATFCPVTDQLGEKMREFKMLNLKGSSVYTTVPNVVDTEMFTIASENEVKGDEVRLLHVSSLDESQKNITGILHTLATLINLKPEFHFCAKFVGGNDTEKLGKLRTYAASLGLTETYVTFSGPLSSEEVAKCMQSADALVLFSRNENFPCVIAEAWASGVPVISTDVGGISEHLIEESGRGILIESEDESGLREAILSLGDGAKFNSDEIRKYAIQHFSVEAISEAFDQVYREALKSGAE
jgi:glycosyltransferase involved in cell wall biosynthesis